jgi:hypothetical protein
MSRRKWFGETFFSQDSRRTGLLKATSGNAAPAEGLVSGHSEALIDGGKQMGEAKRLDQDGVRSQCTTPVN